METLELVESLIKVFEIEVLLLECFCGFVPWRTLPVTAALRRVASACMFDQNLPHCSRGRVKEIRARGSFYENVGVKEA